MNNSNKKNLIDYIGNLPKTRVLFTSSNNGEYNIDDLSSIIRLIRSKYSNLEGKSLTLLIDSDILLALLILALDGFASKLTLLSPSLNETDLHLLLEASKASTIITQDQNFTFKDIDILYVKNNSFNNSSLISTEQTRINHSTNWLLPTSGTTGSPKLVSHTLSSLIGIMSQRPDDGIKFTWGLLYNLNRFAGLQVFLQSIISGCRLLIPNNSVGLTEKAAFFKDNNCNCLSATPTMWRKLLMLPNFSQLTLKQITLGGEISDQQILDALNNKFPSAKIIHIYASTELGVGFLVKDKLAGFPKSYIDDHSIKARVDSEGGLWLLPKKTRTSYLTNDEFLVDENGYIYSGDKVKEVNDRFIFLGRDSGVINVGGNKVFPENIENTLLNYQGLKLVRVYAKKSSIMGQLVCADIVIDTNIINTKEYIVNLKKYCAENMKTFQIPALFKIVDDLNINSTGKLNR